MSEKNHNCQSSASITTHTHSTTSVSEAGLMTFPCEPDQGSTCTLEDTHKAHMMTHEAHMKNTPWVPIFTFAQTYWTTLSRDSKTFQFTAEIVPLLRTVDYLRLRTQVVTKGEMTFASVLDAGDFQLQGSADTAKNLQM